MPNTLAHIGIQTLCSRALAPRADLKWIAVGCILPDLPWIVQRLVKAAGLVDPIDLRLYVMIQASLFFCLLLAGALALFHERPARLFSLLSLNCLLHLLLDASQIKWANGVQLLAPFSWQVSHWGLFWPESTTTLLLSGLGLLTLLICFQKAADEAVRLRLRPGRVVLVVALLCAYFLAPLALLHGPEAANAHFTGTLRRVAERPSVYVEFDRARYDPSGPALTPFTGERIRLSSPLDGPAATVSIQGRFLDRHTLRVDQVHMHGKIRDFASLAGLLLALALWLVALWKKRIILA